MRETRGHSIPSCPGGLSEGGAATQSRAADSRGGELVPHQNNRGRGERRGGPSSLSCPGGLSEGGVRGQYHVCNFVVFGGTTVRQGEKEDTLGTLQ